LHWACRGDNLLGAQYLIEKGSFLASVKRHVSFLGANLQQLSNDGKPPGAFAKTERMQHYIQSLGTAESIASSTKQTQSSMPGDEQKEGIGTTSETNVCGGNSVSDDLLLTS
jgi:hypothetical protein